MSYKVLFNNNNLSDYCTVLNVTRSILPSRSNFSKTVPTLNGSYYTGGKYSERTIPIEVAIFAKNREEYAQKIGKLAEILNVNQPSPLIIEDEPYKVYYAIVDGVTELSKKFFNGVATINFMCNDPYAESSYWNAFRDNGNGVFNVTSYGTVETYPIVDVDFRSGGCFFQLTNYEGKTVLIGKPKDGTKPSIAQSDIVINDNCQSVSTFTTISQTLFDQNRVITGNYGVNSNGKGIVCSNFGTAQANKWTGAGFKRNLNVDVADFEVIVDLTFSSQGENYVEPPPSPPAPAPKPEPTPPSMPTTPDTSTTNPQPAPPTVTPKPPATSLGTYKVVNCGGLWINKTADVSQPLYAMAPGTLIYPDKISNGWAKHTHSNKWHTFTGWSSMKYLKKVSNSGRSRSSEVETLSTEYADEQLGLIEIYGFDRNGAKLFKFEIADTNSYYEFVEPKISIGSTVVLKDNKNVPAARKADGKEMPSGVFGDFNDFVGQFSIKREKNTAGQNIWSAEIRKIVNGKITKSISTSNGLASSVFPKGDLNYIGVFISRYGESEPVSVMNITNIYVKNLKLKTDQYVTDNVTIFKTGDHMQINFEDGQVTLNDESLLSQLDIGSEFFTIPSGSSQFAFRTDAQTSVVCGFKDRFI